MARPRKPPRLKQRGRIWYIYDGDEIPFSTRTAILSEAEAHLAQYVAALDSPISPREPTVCDLIDAFEQGRWEKAKNRAANAAEKNANACGIESAEEIARLRELAAAGITKMDAIGNDTYAFQALKIHLGPLLVSQINSGTARQYERDRRAARRNLAAAAKSAGSRIPGGGFLAEATIARDLKRLRAALSWAAAEDVRGWFGQSERIPTFEMSVGVTYYLAFASWKRRSRHSASSMLPICRTCGCLSGLHLRRALARRLSSSCHGQPYCGIGILSISARSSIGRPAPISK